MWEAGAKRSLHFMLQNLILPMTQHCHQYLYWPRWHLAIHRLRSPAIKVVLWYLPEAKRQLRWMGGEAGPEMWGKHKDEYSGMRSWKHQVSCFFASLTQLSNMGIQSIFLWVTCGQPPRHYCHVGATWSRFYCQPCSGHLPWEANLTPPGEGSMFPPRAISSLVC